MKDIQKSIQSVIVSSVLICVLMSAGVAASPQADRVLWSYDFPGELWSSPQYDSGVLYFGCDDGIFYAFDLEKREVTWSIQTHGIIRSTPNISDGIVTFASDDGTLYALDQESGAELWKFDLGGSLLTRRLPAPDAPYRYDYLSSSPVFSAGVLYIGSMNGRLFAIDHQTGKELWRFETSEMIRSTPLVRGGRVYFGCWNGEVFALEAETGERVWSFDCGASVQGSPAFGSGKIVVGSRSAKIFALNAETGKVEWEYASPTGSWIESSPVIEGSVVYIGTSDALLLKAFELDSGAELWSYATGGWSWSTPTLAGGVAYIGGISAYPYYFEGVDLKSGFYAVDMKTGQEKWNFSSEPIEGYITGGVFARAVVVGDVVYVCGLDGKLYALSTDSAPSAADE